MSFLLLVSSVVELSLFLFFVLIGQCYVLLQSFLYCFLLYSQLYIHSIPTSLPLFSITFFSVFKHF